MPIRPKKPSQPDQPLPANPPAPANTATPAKIDPRVLADIAVNPITTAATLTQLYNKGSVGDVDVVEMAAAIKAVAADFAKGDHTAQRAMLIGQSITLNAIFVEMARRAHLNFPDHFEASERLLRLALKAQAQSRATIEALDRMANGREQVVRHVHVDNRGGQAVIAENVQTGGQGNANGKIDTQPHAQSALGTSLPSPDPFGNGVPIPSREGQPAMQNARRNKSGGT